MDPVAAVSPEIGAGRFTRATEWLQPSPFVTDCLDPSDAQRIGSEARRGWLFLYIGRSSARTSGFSD
jgi:hypothetical protein